MFVRLPQFRRFALVVPLVKLARSSIADRAFCSSLFRLKQPAEITLQAITELGYHWVDVSSLK